jgi:hypothetical protein
MSARTFLRGAVGEQCEQRASLLGVALSAHFGAKFMHTMSNHDWAWWPTGIGGCEPRLKFNDRAEYVETLEILAQHREVTCFGMSLTFDGLFWLVEHEGIPMREVEEAT